MFSRDMKFYVFIIYLEGDKITYVEACKILKAVCMTVLFSVC